MFQFTWPLCTPPMFKFGPRGFQNWFYIHCSSNQKKVPSAQTFFAPNRSKLGKWTIQNHCGSARALEYVIESIGTMCYQRSKTFPRLSKVQLKTNI